MINGNSQLREIASTGYIVIANMSATGKCHEMSKDMIRSIEWAKTDSKYKNMIDWNSGVGIHGYSMGAYQSHATAANVHVADAVKNFDIRAVVASHPGPLDEFPSLVPIFYQGGSAD